MCGIFGIYGHPEASKLAYLGLYALQHRGQESAGIAASDGKFLHSYREMGLVADIFKEDVLEDLKGDKAISHTRYSTTGSSLLKNAQPFVVDYLNGSVAVAHNGNLVNALMIREELEKSGSIFQSTMDTEIIIHLIAKSRSDFLIDKIIDALKRLKGAYSLLFLTEDSLIVVRDPHGFRPLVLGSLKGSYIFASETCALDLIEAKFVREIGPGELIVINNNGLNSYKPFKEEPLSFCIFEFVYFSRPDSNIMGKSVYEVRKNLGKELFKEHPVDADLVIPIPDSGVPAAIGFSIESKIPFETALIRNHYVGRTFIEPQDSIRHFGVRIKLNPIEETIKGKRIVIIDDSIVRGTTIKKIINMIKQCDPKEIHVRISSPPTTHSCFYGIDTPDRMKLIAATHNVKEIREFLGSDSLEYLSIEGLHRGVENNGSRGFCDACFTGEYPVAIPPSLTSYQLNLFWKERLFEFR
jgi:amidophosphoribosyltransferase